MASSVKNAWIEAMRLRTLPVSVAGVIAAVGYNIADHSFEIAPAVLCLVFAVLAQIASNFANEYYDYKAGIDRPGRQGPRRGVTEGDISPEAMRTATFVLLGTAGIVGCTLMLWGGWWLIVCGIVIVAGALSYSTGPYPLSRHALGEVAVVFFFGIIPVNLTYYVQALQWSVPAMMGSLSIGLMGANVLIINNYRDIDDDRAVGKVTLAVKMGRKATSAVYLINGFVAMTLIWCQKPGLPFLSATLLYLLAHVCLWGRMRRFSGASLNPLLGMTAMLMLLFSLALISSAIAGL